MTRSAADLNPLSAFLGAWFAEGPPSIALLDADARARGLATGGGAPLRFVSPGGSPLAYEERAFLAGEVETRPDNRHDLFNALIWLFFPRAKAAMNRRHHEELRAARARGDGRRGAVRDALTQFDECGVIVAGSRPDLWRSLREHRWREVFVERREELTATTCFIVFGHASHDLLAAPFPGLCGKALFVELDLPPADSAKDVLHDALDRHLAGRFAHDALTPRDLQPLPLLGIPGATPASENPAYYDDARQFRPARTMGAGSPPGNR